MKVCCLCWLSFFFFFDCLTISIKNLSWNHAILILLLLFCCYLDTIPLPFEQLNLYIQFLSIVLDWGAAGQERPLLADIFSRNLKVWLSTWLNMLIARFTIDVKIIFENKTRPSPLNFSFYADHSVTSSSKFNVDMNSSYSCLHKVEFELIISLSLYLSWSFPYCVRCSSCSY